MSETTTIEGWTDFGGQARKFHYVPADNPRALCGKWGLWRLQRPQRTATVAVGPAPTSVCG